MKVETLPSGNKRVRVYVPAERKYKSFTAATGREAKEKANEYRVLHKHDKDGEYITVYEALTRYCDAKENILSPVTLANYERMKNRYFESIKDYPIKSITTESMQNFINDLSVNLSSKTVRNIYSFFSSAYSMFGQEELKVSLPQSKKFVPHVLTDNEVKLILEKTKGTELGTAIKLAIFIPARRSEICALDPKTDIINGRFININKAVVINKNHEWVISKTKTYESTRIVEMPPEILQEFTHKLNFTPNALTEMFVKKVVEELGIPCRFHDLRHYGATFLHAQGVPDKYIMQRGGWSSVSTLQNIYTHTLPETTDDATAKVTAKFNALTS